MIRHYLVTGLIVFSSVLVLSFPAQVAYRWFAPNAVVLDGISGTFWTGTATEGMAGKAYIRDITWHLKPMDLLSGDLTFITSSKPPSGSIYTDVSLSLNGNLTLSKFSGNVPLDVVHLIFQQNGIRADLSFDFDRIILSNEFPVSVIGEMQIGNLYIPDLSAGVLGNFSANFRTNNNSIQGEFKDLSGVLQVKGLLSILSNRSYSLAGRVAARRGATPSIEQQLRLLGSPDEDGLREFRLEGRL